MINIREYQKGDIYKIRPKKDVYSDDPTLLKRMDELALSRESYSNTYINGLDEVIAIIGLTMLWPRVAEIWAVISEDVKKEPISFHKRIMHALHFYAENLDIKKYQVYVKAEYSDGKKWMHNLGFKIEGLLEKFGADGKDYVIMGRVN